MTGMGGGGCVQGRNQRGNDGNQRRSYGEEPPGLRSQAQGSNLMLVRLLLNPVSGTVSDGFSGKKAVARY